MVAQVEIVEAAAASLAARQRWPWPQAAAQWSRSTGTSGDC